MQAQNESEFLETIGIEARNQVEMNAQAHHLMDLTQKQLEYLVEVLQLKLSGEEREAFEKVQTAWRAFARRQADFASLIFDSGSMQPMIRAAELRALTVERAGQIKQEIKQRQELFD